MAVDWSSLRIETTEMHTGGEPLRIVTSGYPPILGSTVLEKRAYIREKLDNLRRFLMWEPRGHRDMYGALLVKSSEPEAHFGVIFMHNEGYSTMCGHAVIALARYFVDKRPLIDGEATQAPILISSFSGQKHESDTQLQVNIDCPCGLVTAFVTISENEQSNGCVTFQSVPAFTFAADFPLNVPAINPSPIFVDIAFGGTFYLIVDESRLGISVGFDSPNQADVGKIAEIATALKAAAIEQVKLQLSPERKDLEFIYGTIVTSELQDLEVPADEDCAAYSTENICVFADKEIDRCPTGSGVVARMALMAHKEQIEMGEVVEFRSGINGSKFLGMVVEKWAHRADAPHGHPAFIVEVSGKAHYSGTASFIGEADDPLLPGFLVGHKG